MSVFFSQQVSGQIQKSAYIASAAGIPQSTPMVQIPSASGTLPMFPTQSLYGNDLTNIFKCCVSGQNGRTISFIEYNATTPTEQPTAIGLSNTAVSIRRDGNDSTGNSVYICARNNNALPFIPAYHYSRELGNNFLRFRTFVKYNLGTGGLKANKIIFDSKYSSITLTEDDTYDNWIVSSATNVSFSNW